MNTQCEIIVWIVSETGEQERRKRLFIILFMHPWSFCHKGNKACPTVCCFYRLWEQFNTLKVLIIAMAVQKQMKEHTAWIKSWTNLKQGFFFFFLLYNKLFLCSHELRTWPVIMEDKQHWRNNNVLLCWGNTTLWCNVGIWSIYIYIFPLWFVHACLRLFQLSNM